MKVKSINLTDFQGHEAFSIDFSPRITTIVGPTDSGKSSILRALRWVCLNDTRGDEFIRDGTKTAQVTIKLSNDDIVTRTKGNGVNTYSINNSLCKAFGSDVPEDIAKLLSISPINFQGQHDSPFWFCETAGEVSRQLNAVIDLSIIDDVISRIQSRVQHARNRKVLVEERIQLLKEQLKDEEKLRKRIEDWGKVSALAEAENKIIEQIEELSYTVASAENNHNTAIDSRKKENALLAVIECADEVIRLNKKVAKLTERISSIKSYRQQAKAPPNFEPVEEAYSENLQQEEDLKSLNVLIRQIEEAKARVKRTKAARASAEEQFHERISGAACPICGQKFNQ